MALTDLHSIDLLITRPRAQAQGWAQELQGLGVHTHLFPVLSIEPISTAEAMQDAKNIALNIDQYQKLIFVSQNAVQQAALWFDRFWPQWPVTMECFAVGESTASAATAAGFTLVASAAAAMNSETLLALPSLQRLDREKVLIVRGIGGRETLATELRRRGAVVDYWQLYQRQMPIDAPSQFARFQWRNSERIGVLSVHSGESLKNLQLLIAACEQWDLYQLPIIVPGPRVAAEAKAMAFQQPIAAENATNRSMTNALIQWQSGKHL